jgi:hypothetical protein
MSQQFAELLKSLSAVADEQDNGPAAGNDDETIAAAAADSGVSADANPEDDADDAGEADAAPVAKSLVATGADGEELEVVDATEILKSLEAKQTEHGDVLAKALGTMTSIAQKQGELIKSLQAEVKALAAQGRGRKTLVTVSERPDTGAMAKSQAAAQPTVTPQQIMAKCLTAQKAGTMTSLDVARAEVAINNGVAVPADILSRIQ